MRRRTSQPLGLGRVEPKVLWKRIPPAIEFELQLVEHPRELGRALVGTPLSVDAAQDVAHDERQLAEGGECRGAVCRRAKVVRGGCGVGEWLPVLELLVAVKELDWDQGVGFLEADWATLIETLDLVDDFLRVS